MDKLFLLFSLRPIFFHFVQYASFDSFTISNFLSLRPISFTLSNFLLLRPIWGHVTPEFPLTHFQHLLLLTLYWPIVYIRMDRLSKRSNPSISTGVSPPAKKSRSAFLKRAKLVLRCVLLSMHLKRSIAMTVVCFANLARVSRPRLPQISCRNARRTLAQRLVFKL